MKLKALINCTGEGYENLKAGEEREVKKEVGKLLEGYGYAEIIEQDIEEDKEELIARAKELGIEGVLSNFKIETLKKKIEEAEIAKTRF